MTVNSNNLFVKIAPKPNQSPILKGSYTPIPYAGREKPGAGCEKPAGRSLSSLGSPLPAAEPWNRVFMPIDDLFRTH